MSDYQFKNQLEEFSYSLGLTISSNLLQSGVTEIEPTQFLAAISDTLAGNKPKITLDEANYILQQFVQAINHEKAEQNLKDGLLYLSNNINNEDVTETESGLQYKVLKEGYGASPTIDDQIKCHYHGYLLDGTVFDSSVERKQPVVFPVNAVIQGWTEALQLMSVGAQWRLFIPSNLAYGEEGAGGLIGPNAALIFDVELLEIIN
jgi:FKBP-type peptidyl-prolyl cis-trans isomerase FklB